ncbi:EamA family transporter [Ovoidimarina sediminis]|uniref:EamA family transporter n=1 Tax=Ovoidimarina sediminis TaxID=3079856 RepID=UPI00290EA42C|nr:EamA family transporter [Rhodophyticola sp. MJ-SS7]MDU8941806.1 EamA family transporter [Rhodophyticola sp. MJ-SS7]
MFLGEILALLSALAFALFNVTVSATSGSRGDKGVLFSVIVTIGFSAAVFLVLEAGRAPIPTGPDTWWGLAFFAGAGVSAMAFGRSLVFSSIRRLGPTRASAVKRLNPFFSVVLAALILAEPVTALDGWGLLAIACAFALLVSDSLRRANAAQASVTPLAYGIGAAAALAYAVAYVGRKAGLDLVDAPALGTLVSALAGFAAFALLALVSPVYRGMFRGVFRNIDRPVLFSAILVSVGQILMFAALAHAPVTTVVMISSLEIFFSLFLSWLVFGTEQRPGLPVFLSAALAVTGVVLVAAG